MYAGQVVESGTVAEVLGHPAHPYTAALLGANPHVTEGLPVPARLPAIPGTVPAPPDWPPGCRFAGRCPLATDACAQPVPATPAHGTGTHGAGTVRCVHPLDPQQAPHPQQALHAPADLPLPRRVKPGVPS
jgi:peptide/nickel transport system permease protein